MSLLTVVVPTRERPAYVRRLLGYFARVRLAYPIVLADSSDDLSAQENAAAVSAAGLEIEYRRFASDISPYAKVSEASENLRTPYVAVCADDDFLVPDGLTEAVKLLESKRELALSHGRAIVVVIDQSGKPTHSLNYPLVERLEANASDRVRLHLAAYRPTFYSTHRKDALVKSMAAARGYATDYRFGELLQSCAAVVHGGVGHFDSLYMVRTDHASRATNAATQTLMRAWESFILAEDFSPRWCGFRAELVRLLEVAGGDATIATAAVDQGFLNFLTQRIQPVPSAISDIANRAWARRQGLVSSAEVLGPTLVRELAKSYRERSVRGLFRDAADEMSLPRLRAPRSRFFREFAEIEAALC